MSFLEGIIYMIWRGLAIGIIISAPMGPVGILCIQRTLDKGRRDGFFTGIGAALSDLFYCLLTGFGLSFIEDFLQRNQDIIQLAGSAVLIGFSVYLFKKNPASNLKKPGEHKSSAKKNILGGFLFTFSNPLILFLIIGLFARFNFLLPEIQFYQYIIGYIFIFTGAIIWWWVVTFFVDKVRAHFNLRSMWLVNRIIGVVILLFAVVGIVSGIMSITQTTAAQTTHWNPSRGFSPFTDTVTSAAVMSNSDSGNLLKEVELPEGTDRLSFTFRLADLNNHPSRKENPPGWYLTARGPEGDIDIHFYSTEETDNISGRRVTKIESTFHPNGASPSKKLESTTVEKKYDHYMGLNAFRLTMSEGRFVLYGGNREYNPLMQFSSPLSSCGSIGFRIPPTGCISLESATLTIPESQKMTRGILSETELKERLSSAKDELSGYWGVFDRSMEENLLTLGGDYHLAITPDEDGYMITYLSGARKNSNKWQPGMRKGFLTPTGFSGIYNLQWIDSEGNPLSHDIKCQQEGKMLTITFPYHNSTLRLRKLPAKN